MAYWIDRLYFARKRVGGIQIRKEKSTHMQKKGGEAWWRGFRFFFWEYEKDNWGERRKIFFGRGEQIDGRWLRERKRRVLEEFWLIFWNEIQKKIVDMEITFPGGTSRGRIGWFGDSLWWRNTRARSKKQTQLDWEEKVTQSWKRVAASKVSVLWLRFVGFKMQTNVNIWSILMWMMLLACFYLFVKRKGMKSWTVIIGFNVFRWVFCWI